MKKICLGTLIISMMLFIGCEKIDSIIENNSTNTTEDNDNTVEYDTSSNDNISTDTVENSSKESYFWQKDITSDTVLVVVNEITDEEYSALNNVEKIILDKESENITVIAAMDKVDLEIWSLDCTDNELVEKELLHQRKNMMQNDAIDIEAIVPEGIPSYKIKGSCEEGVFAYTFTYDGRDGEAHLNYVSYESNSKNSSNKDSLIKTMKSRIFFFDISDLKEYYVDTDIDVEDKAVVKALTKELKNAQQYNSNFLGLDEEVEITSAKIEDGVLKIEFSKDFISDNTLESSEKAGLLNSIVNTVGYNLSVDKVAIYFGDELYKGLNGEAQEGYFKVEISDASEAEAN